MPKITSKFLVFSFKKIVSDEYGPLISILFFFKYLIAGIISSFSLFFFSKLSQ